MLRRRAYYLAQAYGSVLNTISREARQLRQKKGGDAEATAYLQSNASLLQRLLTLLGRLLDQLTKRNDSPWDRVRLKVIEVFGWCASAPSLCALPALPAGSASKSHHQ